MSRVVDLGPSWHSGRRLPESIRARGGTILREAGPMNAGTTILGFVADPDGYQIELLGRERHGAPA